MSTHRDLEHVDEAPGELAGCAKCGGEGGFSDGSGASVKCDDCGGSGKVSRPARGFHVYVEGFEEGEHAYIEVWGSDVVAEVSTSHGIAGPGRAQVRATLRLTGKALDILRADLREKVREEAVKTKEFFSETLDGGKDGSASGGGT